MRWLAFRQAFQHYRGRRIAAARTHSAPMKHTDTVTAGRFLISPITKMLANGWYACSVSIRSGSHGGTDDRLLRLTRLFRTRLAAVHYAIAEGLQWTGHHTTRAEGAAGAL
jgi:hypothetical protein